MYIDALQTVRALAHWLCDVHFIRRDAYKATQTTFRCASEGLIYLIHDFVGVCVLLRPTAPGNRLRMMKGKPYKIYGPLIFLPAKLFFA